ncbi:MAG: LLM class flavin-dependent oxidoreductase, partial [Actinobacteria bacterium]|nr:LLM class flavin-dependent oxidoreductase [Actinomycetota bacterium]
MPTSRAGTSRSPRTRSSSRTPTRSRAIAGSGRWPTAWGSCSGSRRSAARPRRTRTWARTTSRRSAAAIASASISTTSARTRAGCGVEGAPSTPSTRTGGSSGTPRSPPRSGRPGAPRRRRRRDVAPRPRSPARAARGRQRPAMTEGNKSPFRVVTPSDLLPRVGLAFAAGWNPNDFVLQPQNFARRKDVMFEQIEIVKRLWAGESVDLPGPNGDVPVRILPRPIQPELPVWITIAGNPESFTMAGERGYGVLTHLLGQTVDELGEKIALYRAARERVGLDPDAGHVTVMLHTFVGPDDAMVKEEVRAPLKRYLMSSVELIQKAAWAFPTFRQATTSADGQFALDHLEESELDAVLEFSFERYYETGGLLGTPDKCVEVVEHMRAIGVDEIACLIDFHDSTDTVLEHLPYLEDVRRRCLASAGQGADE